MDHVNDWQHSAMYSAFMLSGLVDLATWYGRLPEGIEHVRGWVSGFKSDAHAAASVIVTSLEALGLAHLGLLSRAAPPCSGPATGSEITVSNPTNSVAGVAGHGLPDRGHAPGLPPQGP